MRQAVRWARAILVGGLVLLASPAGWGQAGGADGAPGGGIGRAGDEDEAALVALVREVGRQSEALGEIPFSLVVEATTGRRVMAIEEGDEVAGESVISIPSSSRTGVRTAA